MCVVNDCFSGCYVINFELALHWQITAEKGRKGHIVEFLEIILIVQKTFLDNYNTEPTAINWDQMSLSCKESSSQKH